MKKSVSILAIMLVGVMSAFPSNGAPMTSQIQRLLDQKEEKIKKLEECEGKKKGWMIAGISTIGLTAVGVGVNIAQASKSNKLSSEIEQSKQELERQQEKLSRIESQISASSGVTKSEVEEASSRIRIVVSSVGDDYECYMIDDWELFDNFNVNQSWVLENRMDNDLVYYHFCGDAPVRKQSKEGVEVVEVVDPAAGCGDRSVVFSHSDNKLYQCNINERRWIEAKFENFPVCDQAREYYESCESSGQCFIMDSTWSLTWTYPALVVERAPRRPVCVLPDVEKK